MENTRDKPYIPDASFVSENDLQEVLDHLDAAVFCIQVINRDHFIYGGFNQVHQRLTGLVSQDLIGKRPEDIHILPPQVRLALKRNYQRCVDSENGIEYQEDIEVNGKKTYWLTRLTPVRDQNGQVKRIIGLSSQISDIIRKNQKLAEDQQSLTRELIKINKDLEASHETYRLATEATNQGVWDWNVTTNTVWYSETWKRQIGYRDDELENDFKTWQDHLHPDDYERCNKAVMDFLSNPVGKFKLEFRFRHKNGHYVHIHNEASPALNESGQVTRMIGTHADITDQFNRETEIKESEVRFRTLFHEIPDAAYIADTETGLITMVNRAGCEMIGRSEEEILGMHQSELHPAGQKKAYKQEFKQSIAHGLENKELELQHKNGQIIPAQVVSVPFEIDGKKLIVGLFRDISERRKTEAELKKSMQGLDEANQAKDRLISILAHDLKTPFNGILGLLEVLNVEYDSISENDRKKFINKLYLSAAKTYELLENLLNWSRIQQGKLKPIPMQVSLKDMIDECISYLEPTVQAKEIRINSLVSKTCIVIFDKNMLETVTRNLLTNAIKFTPRGGSVSLTSRLTEKGRCELTVEDSGVGIPPDKLQKILDLRHNVSTAGTENEKGTGLGLILCKEFVELNGGQLTISSEPNKGTRISITLKHKKNAG